MKTWNDFTRLRNPQKVALWRELASRNAEERRRALLDFASECERTSDEALTVSNGDASGLGETAPHSQLSELPGRF